MSKDKSNLTEKEMRLLALSWQCMDTNPPIDYDKLAKLSGYTISSAKTYMGNIKRKIRLMGGDDSGGPKTPGSGGKRKAAAREAGTPKRGKATPKGSPLKGKPTLDPPEEEEDDEEPVKKEEDFDEDFEGVSSFEF